MTGVKNKAACQEVITNLENRMKLEQVEFAVIVLDINNLKVVNDNLGYEEGDLLISNTCSLASQTFQNSSVF